MVHHIHRRTAHVFRAKLSAPLEQLGDEELGAYCDAHLGDEALAAAMEPINRWIEARDQAPQWEVIAESLNAYPVPSLPEPPVTGDQVATLALCLEMARVRFVSIP